MSALLSPLLSFPRLSSIAANSTGLRNSARISTTNAAAVAAATAANTHCLMSSTSAVAMASAGSNCSLFRFHTNDGSYPLANGSNLKSWIAVSKWNQRSGSFTCLASDPNNQFAKDSSTSDFYVKVLGAARAKFTEEISIQSKDKDISLAKAMLCIAAEDEAFMALNRLMDAPSLLNVKRGVSSHDSREGNYLELMPLAGKKLSEWLSELDVIAREVEAELVSRDISCDLIVVLEAVNLVLFGDRCFKRLHAIAVDPEFSYLHRLLNSKIGNPILLSIVYIEVCQRLGLTIFGSGIGKDFVIWPQTDSPQELFKADSGRSIFAIINGSCVEDPVCMASELNSSSLSALAIATNRDIIGVALTNLIRVHWKRASRMEHGFLMTNALKADYCFRKPPQILTPDLCLGILAAERLLILQPHNWVVRMEHGLMLYYNKEYDLAIEELSVCMVFAPEKEVAVLKPFVERLHLIRRASTWKSEALRTS